MKRPKKILSIPVSDELRLRVAGEVGARVSRGEKASVAALAREALEAHLGGQPSRRAKAR